MGNFTSEEVVDHNQTKRYLHHPGAVQGEEYRIEYRFSPEPGLPACIYDVRCFHTAEEALNHSAAVDEGDPVGKNYRYNRDINMTKMVFNIFFLVCFKKKLRFETYLLLGTNFGGWYVLEENYIMKNHVNVPTSPNVPTGGYVSKRNTPQGVPCAHGLGWVDFISEG